MIEIEKRALITKDKYKELLEIFQKEGKLTNRFKRHTIIGIQRSDFVPDTHGDKDLRIRSDGKTGLLTLKIGNWHTGEARKELEIHFNLSEIKDAMGILVELGSPYCVSVYIERKEYAYKDYTVSLDKYFFNDDYIIDFEKLTKNQDEKYILKEEHKIESCMNELGLKVISSKEMIRFINKLNFIKEAQHDFRKTSLDDWYEEWEKYIFCRV